MDERENNLGKKGLGKLGGIDYDKIDMLRKNMSFLERLQAKTKVEDLMDVRTFEGRVYRSKFEFWNERRKDVGDEFACCYRLCLPSPISDIVTFLTRTSFSLLSVAVLPSVRKNLKYSEEKSGYVMRGVE